MCNHLFAHAELHELSGTIDAVQQARLGSLATYCIITELTTAPVFHTYSYKLTLL